MRYKLIAKEHIHLFKRLSFRFREEEPIACEGNDVEDEEDIEVFKLYGAERLRGELCKDQVDCPVRECCNGITEGSDLNREDLNALLVHDVFVIFHNCLLQQGTPKR